MKNVLGHTTLSMTQRYIKSADKTRADDLANLLKVPNLSVDFINLPDSRLKKLSPGTFVQMPQVIPEKFKIYMKKKSRT